MTKRIWRFEGWPTPDWVLAEDGAQVAQAFARLGSPMIVKPAREGSTIGLTKVTDLSQCEAAYALAAAHDERVLCEQFIAGEEVTCAVLGQTGRAQALPMIKIVAPDGNYDYHNKYIGEQTQYIVPSGLPSHEEEAIQGWVLKAYQSLGCRGWGRIDVMIDALTRRPYLLEINTSPGMTGHSLVPMAARAAGMSYEQLCLQVLGMAALDGVSR